MKSTALIFRTRKRIWIFSFPVRFSLSGTWDFGTAAVWGTKEIESGNISDCLYTERDIDNATWYVDKNGDFRCEAIHHDGTNHYLYRVYKDGVSETQIDNLKEKLYRGTATRTDIVRITRRLGDEIAKVHRFPIPRQRRAAEQER